MQIKSNILLNEVFNPRDLFYGGCATCSSKGNSHFEVHQLKEDFHFGVFESKINLCHLRLSLIGKNQVESAWN